ncbi:MAG: restriction endonuclease subunit S [Candidatus Marinimicrobia bacterium CG_4_10_14_0_2_um_filter_48_9]|nr:MAG: restriction endonuclease subunit S [Candidatus Marinimicrobia bacterium CG_4_10_14_0_2_um_filter_48_9]
MPILRFSEFNEDWREVRLGDLCENFKSGIGITAEKIFSSGDFPVYGGNGLRGYTDRYTHDGYYLLIGRQGALCGNINRANGKTYISEHAIAVSGNKYSNTEWLAQKLEYMRLNRLSESSAQPGLSVNKLVRIKLVIPSQLEQQKIAAFLSAVDQKIQLLQRKKELLERYKKGVMQKLFSQEIRFKKEDGNDYPEWEEKRLAEFLIPTLRRIHKPLLPYLAIGVRSHFRGTFQKPNFDPSKINMDKLFIVREGDLIVNITFAWEGAVALVKTEDDGGLVSHRFPTYTFNERKVLSKYFSYVFCQKRFKQILDLISPGGAGRNRVLNKKELLKVKQNFPSIPEQRKISELLTYLDNKIEFTDKEINRSNLFKRGLLQQMFV